MRSLRFVLVLGIASLGLLGAQPSDATAQRFRMSAPARPMVSPAMRSMMSTVRPRVMPFRPGVARFGPRAFDNRFRSGFFFPSGAFYGGYVPGLVTSGAVGSYGGSPYGVSTAPGSLSYSSDGPYAGSSYAPYGPYGDVPYTTNGLPAGAPTAPGQAAQVASVGISDNYFQPSRIAVPVGATVQWTNYGQQTHTITWDSDGWGSGELRPREVFSYTFNRPGTYAYHCARYSDMHGVVEVVPGGSAK